MWCMRSLRRTGRFPCVPGSFNPALIWEIMKKVLVTGSSGFIGPHLVTTFADRGYEVGEIDIAHPHNPFDARQFFKGRGPDVDVVIHAAAVVGGRKKVVGSPLDHAENLEIDAAMFQWARENRPGRVVYFSSSCAYPVNQQREKNQLHEDDISLPPRGRHVPGRVVRVDEAHRGVPRGHREERRCPGERGPAVQRLRAGGEGRVRGPGVRRADPPPG